MERRNISIRTKQALAAAKARGVRLGNLAQAKVNKREADRYAKTLKPILLELRHLPVETIAAELTKRKVETPRDGRWHGRTVARLLDRLHLRWLPGLMAGRIEPGGCFFRRGDFRAELGAQLFRTKC